jgi:GNAT superfamily N-acetyltransferase
MGRPDGGTAHHLTLWEPYVEGALTNGWTWVAGAGDAVSVWVPPGGVEMTPAQEQGLVELAHAHLGDGAGRYLDLVERFEAAHPRHAPHYYLTLLGTHPDARGHGFGMALLAHDLELIDAEAMPAYLESSNPINDERYAGHGFEPIGRIVAPGGRFTVTTMWRDPR